MANPEEDQSERVKRATPFINRAAPYLFTACLFGEAVIGAELFSKGEFSSRIKNWVGDRLYPPPAKPLFPKESESGLRPLYDRGLEEAIEKSLASYEEWQKYGQTSLQYLLQYPQSQEILENMDQMARNTVIGSVSLLKTAWILGHIEDKVDIDQNYASVRINYQNYDLRDRFQVQLANVWMQTKLEYVAKKIRLTHEWVSDDEKATIRRQLVNLEEEEKLMEWFRSINPPVNPREGSYVFFPQFEIVDMARVFKAVYDQGYTFPKKIDYCGAGCFENTNVLGRARADLNTAEVKNRYIATYTLAHEIGHLVSSQRDLIVKFTEIRGMVGADSAENRLKSVTDYALTNSFEDFAETFAKYLSNGDYFRLMLEQLRLHNPEAYAVLNRKYEFMKMEVFKGVEFSSSAKRRNLEVERKEQEFSGIRVFPEEGNRIEIRPNPAVIPGQSFASIQIPLVVEGRLVDVWIQLFIETGSQRGYRVNLYDRVVSTSITEVSLYPLVGDEKVRVNRYYDREGILPKENLDVISINLRDYSERTGGVSVGFGVESLPNTNGS